MPNPLLLIHGAAHGAWCWEMLVPRLKLRGVPTLTLDLPGLGNDVTPPAEVTFQHYLDAIIERMQHYPSLTLLGHSMGGWPISAVAELCPQRVSKLIYLASFIPRDGESIRSMSAYLASLPEPSALDSLKDSAVPGAHEFDANRAADTFYNQCPPHLAARAVARLRPQADGPLQGELRLSNERFGRIPKTYIVCAHDRALPVTAQHAFCERAAGITKHVLDADHSPFFSAPDVLADLLAREVD